MRFLTLAVLLSLYTASSAQTYDWAFTHTGTASRGMAMVADEQGNVYVCGNINGIADFDPGPDTVLNVSAGINGDHFLAKYGPSGNYIWHICIGGSGTEIPKGLALDHSGNLLMVGRFDSYFDWDPREGEAFFGSAGSTDGFLAKYDTSGAFVWAKRIGGAGHDETYGVAVDELDNIHVAGQMSGPINFGTVEEPVTLAHEGGTWDAFCVRYRPDGALDWVRGIQGTGGQRAQSIAYANGHVYPYGVCDNATHVGDATLTSGNNNQGFLCKLDTTGQVKWLLGHGGAGSEIGEAIRADDQHLYITGSYSDVTDADPGPGVIELQPYGVGGNLYFAKLDTAGNALWAHGLQNNNHFDGVCDIACDAQGRVYVTGAHSVEQDFDPGPDETILPMTIANDLYLAMYVADGSFGWARGVATLGVFDTANGLATDVLGNVFVTGSFGDTAVFDNHAATDTLTGPGMAFFLARYGTDITTPVVEPLAAAAISVFPNPTRERLFIVWPTGWKADRVLLTDASGRILQRWSQQLPRELDAQRLAPGNYHLHAWNGVERLSTAFIVAP
ncbi:MAG: SBBP repeat-containing protein [Flavobacteriales bacterium]|nr:SBBP repeat-containing protein [Flavobacteriales bacterium]